MPAFAAAHWFAKVTIFYSFYIKILSKISLTYFIAGLPVYRFIL